MIVYPCSRDFPAKPLLPGALSRAADPTPWPEEGKPSSAEPHRAFWGQQARPAAPCFVAGSCHPRLYSVLVM